MCKSILLIENLLGTLSKLDENAKLIETFIVSISAIWIFGILFSICELGERMTYHFEMFGKELEQCDWHKLPIQMQRMHLIFLLDTQQPKNITCYGDILCTRETFKMVFNFDHSLTQRTQKFETHSFKVVICGFDDTILFNQSFYFISDN